MKSWRSEPSLREMLEDPIVRLVMRRDGVDKDEVRELLRPPRGEDADEGRLSLKSADKGS